MQQKSIIPSWLMQVTAKNIDIRLLGLVQKSKMFT